MRFDPFGIFAKRDLRGRRRASAEYARTAARPPSAEHWRELWAAHLSKRDDR